MSEPSPPSGYVAIEVAGEAANIPARTLRHWVASGKLSAIAGKRGKLVSMGDIERLAALVGKHDGNAQRPRGNPTARADEVAETIADTRLVTDPARQQLASIRDEWLVPLVDRIGNLERENGRLEAERDELRRRAEAAEAERDELRRQAVPMPLPEVSSQSTAPAASDAPALAAGFWRRVRRAVDGE